MELYTDRSIGADKVKGTFGLPIRCRAHASRTQRSMKSMLCQERLGSLHIAQANQDVKIGELTLRHIAIGGCSEKRSFKEDHRNAALFELTGDLRQNEGQPHIARRVRLELLLESVQYSVWYLVRAPALEAGVH